MHVKHVAGKFKFQLQGIVVAKTTNLNATKRGILSLKIEVLLKKFMVLFFFYKFSWGFIIKLLYYLTYIFYFTSHSKKQERKKEKMQTNTVKPIEKLIKYSANEWMTIKI